MEVLIFVLCSAMGASAYSLSVPANDTIRELLISTFLWTCLSTWIVLIINDFIQRDRACAGLALLTWALWTRFTSELGSKLINNITDKLWNKKDDSQQ